MNINSRSSRVRYFSVSVLLLIIISGVYASVEKIGTPVQQGFLLNYCCGPDEHGKKTKLYFAFHQPGSTLLVQVTPGEYKSQQFTGPKGITAPWGLACGNDNKVYLGSSGHILVFDPAHPEKQLVDLGKPAESETYIWRMDVSSDGVIYGSTYPNCKLISYDPQTGKLSDWGRLDRTQTYGRPMTAAKDGWIYAGVGPEKCNVVAFNPKTKEMKPILSGQLGSSSQWALVYKGSDGYAYGKIGTKHYKYRNGEGIEISVEEKTAPMRSKLESGWELVSAENDGQYKLINPKSEDLKKLSFSYKPEGSAVFVLDNGPGGKIYGSTLKPLAAFSYDPDKNAFEDLGKVSSSGGQVYSFTTYEGHIFICSYPKGRLSRYNPSKALNYGTGPDNNPRDFGSIGAHHDRPRTMVTGPDNKIYIGGYPDYGVIGGALTVFDPEQNKVERHIKDVVRNQSIIALAVSDKHNLIFGGSNVLGGSGAKPVEKEAHFFVWDPSRDEKILDLVPVQGHGAVISLCCKGDKVFMITAKSHDTWGNVIPKETYYLVFDIPEMKIIFRQIFSFGKPVDTSLGVGPDGDIYGLTRKGIFRIDALTYDFNIVEEPRSGVRFGFAIDDRGLYYTSGSNIWRYNWAK